MKIPSAKLIELCDDEGINVHINYSGRYMYGDTCIGIVGNGADLMKFALRVIPKIDPNFEFESELHMNADEPEITIKHSDVWLDMNQDNMGMDMIFYWMGVVTEDID